MERSAKKVVYAKPVDDTEDRKIIERVIEDHDYEPMDATKLKKFIEEKRHKIKRFPKKPTKIVENQINNQINKVNKTEPDMHFIFKSDDASEEEIKLKGEIKLKEEIKLKSSIKKPTKIKEEIKKDDSDDDSEEEIKPKTSIKKLVNKSTNKPEKVNDKSESEEELLSKIQLLNQELFKENSNKSRNETIKNAWKTLSEYELPNNNNLIIKKSHPGHFVTMGCNAGSLKNPHWLVVDKKTKEEYYILYCETNAYTKFSVEDYKEVINPIENKYPTWHIEKIGYIQTKNYITRTTVYLHQIICKKHNEKKYATLSVDHKNRDKLDNRKENLRFATQSEQNQNTDKRNRKYNAKKLPEGLRQEDMPKYVLYYSEMYGTNKDKFREWLNIEKHPKQNEKRWSTSKSIKISIKEKLDQAKAKLEELDL
jgi:hypothetical protein